MECSLLPDDIPEISVRDLGKVFRSRRGDVTALKHVDLDIPAGAFVSLVGPSGCGKSTLLRCLAGLEMPTTGAVFLHGSRLVGYPPSVGVVFQSDVLLDWRTVLDNVLLPIEFRRKDKRQSKGFALSLLRKYGLGGFENRYPWELSGGMRQRVSICRAMIEDPALLLMDEPFAALDAFTRDDLNLELQRIAAETHKTTVFVTHSIPEAVFLADRVIVMASRPGHVVATISVDLSRPRELAVRESSEFGHYTRRVRETFEAHGVLRSAG